LSTLEEEQLAISMYSIHRW